MKKSDLHREWARVLDMCEGTSVNPFFCWKYNGEKRWFNPMHNGEFDGDPNKHEFMVCILNGNPLFLGDKVFWNNDYHVFNWDLGGFSDVSDYERHLSWNPPKKTFMLNGEELPCPDAPQIPGNFYLGIDAGDEGNRKYSVCYKNKNERNKVVDAIIKLLKESTGNGE